MQRQDSELPGMNSHRKTLNLLHWVAISLLVSSLAPATWGSHRVQATWDPNSEPDIAGYRIHYGTNSRVYSVVLDVGNVTNTVITNLLSETTYYFAATAYNTSSLESDLSEEVSLTTPMPDQPPTISLQTQFIAQKQTATPLSGLQVSDPDGSQEMIQLNLTVNRGTLTASSSVSGGLTAAQISGNGSKNLQVIAPLATLTTTLNAANGLVYTGDLNLVGTDTLSATVKNSGSAQPGTTRTAAVQVVGDALDTWRNQYFSMADLVDPTKEITIYGDKADPDQDGLENLLEFALGLSPAASEILQSAVTVGIVPDIDETKHLSITFPRRKNQSLVQYQPEVSSDKITWLSGPDAVVEMGWQDRGAQFELVTFQDLTKVEPAVIRFIRLKVTRNTP
jgi:hypothetical protein